MSLYNGAKKKICWDINFHKHEEVFTCHRRCAKQRRLFSPFSPWNCSDSIWKVAVCAIIMQWIDLYALTDITDKLMARSSVTSLLTSICSSETVFHSLGVHKNNALPPQIDIDLFNVCPYAVCSLNYVLRTYFSNVISSNLEKERIKCFDLRLEFK